MKRKIRFVLLCLAILSMFSSCTSLSNALWGTKEERMQPLDENSSMIYGYMEIQDLKKFGAKTHFTDGRTVTLYFLPIEDAKKINFNLPMLPYRRDVLETTSLQAGWNPSTGLFEVFRDYHIKAKGTDIDPGMYGLFLITASKGNTEETLRFDPNKNKFEVKAGELNYLGAIRIEFEGGILKENKFNIKSVSMDKNHVLDLLEDVYGSYGWEPWITRARS